MLNMNLKGEIDQSSGVNQVAYWLRAKLSQDDSAKRCYVSLIDCLKHDIHLDVNARLL